MLQKHIDAIRAHTQVLRERVLEKWGHRIFLLFAVLAALLVAFVLLHALLFGPPGRDHVRAEFVVRPDQTLAEVSDALASEGYVRHATVLTFAYAFTRGETTIRPGGYTLARDMDAWSVAKILGEKPYLSWVSIPAGVRKEEIAEILAEDLGWTETERMEWMRTTSTSSDLSEGIYYPDIYLIPSDQPPSEIAARMRARFEEVFAPYAADAAMQGMDWMTVVNLAAIVEKEAAKNDKALVAGILWNRLEKDMLLQVDATLQYIRGTEEDWWPVPDADDKDVDSPYNTYAYPGLPVEPIANPSLASIEAVVNPEKTSCLFYLHDAKGRIHCSTNYKAHLSNINRYLK